VVLPEDLCRRLADLAELEARTVSNMARVLIQLGVERFERERSLPGRTAAHPAADAAAADAAAAERFRVQLERQRTRRLRTAPRRLRLQRPD
jgi:hypothetical protein